MKQVSGEPMTKERAIKVLGDMLCIGLDGSPGAVGEEREAIQAALRVFSNYQELEERHQRAMDLVRFARHELREQDLLSDDEFAALVIDADSGQRRARLESYDELRSKLAGAERLLSNAREVAEKDGRDHSDLRAKLAEVRRMQAR